MKSKIRFTALFCSSVCAGAINMCNRQQKIPSTLCNLNRPVKKPPLLCNTSLSENLCDEGCGCYSALPAQTTAGKIQAVPSRNLPFKCESTEKCEISVVLWVKESSSETSALRGGGRKFWIPDGRPYLPARLHLWIWFSGGGGHPVESGTVACRGMEIQWNPVDYYASRP